MGQAYGRDDRGGAWTGRWTQLPDGVRNAGRRALALGALPRDANPMWVVGRGALADSVALSWTEARGWHADVSEGTHHMVVDGYDVWATSLNDMDALQERLFTHIPYDWQATRVDQEHPEMFSWLGMLDLLSLIHI